MRKLKKPMSKNEIVRRESESVFWFYLGMVLAVLGIFFSPVDGYLKLFGLAAIGMFMTTVIDPWNYDD